MWTVLARHAHKVKFLLNENSTTILTGVGVVGTVGTAVLTGRASFKAAKIINNAEINDPNTPIGQIHSLHEDENGLQAEGTLFLKSKIDLSKTEKVKLVWPHFLPPIAVGGGTIAAIVMANRISSKQIAALAIASGVSERAFQEYKDKVLEKLGDRQETAITDEIAQDQVTNNPPSGQVIIAGSGDVLCFEPLTGRYFNSTIETVKAAENKVNYEIIHFEYCSLSHFFDEIGLAPTDYSDMVGWNVANRMEVKFSTTMSEDKRPCLVVGYLNAPSMDYNKSWT